MQNTQLNAGLVAIALVAAAMLMLVPAKPSQSIVLAADVAEKTVTVYQTGQSAITPTRFETECAPGACQEI